MSRHGAEGLVARGHELADKGEKEKAVAAYLEAATLDPSWAAPWFNIGLVHKYRSKWQEAVEANRQALARDPRHEGLWNLGIAATALGDWTLARKAWTDYGIALPEGEGPIEADFGLTPVRVDLPGDPEVVWARRVDPCRAVIASIPFRSCGHRYQDVVLHDGAPNGTRRLGQREVPVFDALERLQPSPWDTFEAEITFQPPDFESLRDIARRAGGNVEDWTTNTRILCTACSEGRPDHDPAHDHRGERAEGDGQPHRIAIAARNREEASEWLQAWEERADGVEVHWLDDGFASECGG